MMRCPYCQSTNVECASKDRCHVHVCHDCGATDSYHGPAKRTCSPLHLAAMGWSS